MPVCASGRFCSPHCHFRRGSIELSTRSARLTSRRVSRRQNRRYPYRWLEQDSPQTKAWIQAERTADQYLNALPSRQRIRSVADRMFATVKYPALDFQASVRTAKGRVFYMRQEPGQNQPLLYVRDTNGTPRVLLDPNKLSLDGTTAVATWQPSPNGEWLAYGLSSAGSDWQKFHIRNVDTLQGISRNARLD